MEILSLLHGRWRLSILAPLAYLVSGALIQKLLFQPNDMPDGLGVFSAPEAEVIRWLGFLLTGALAAVIWTLLHRQTTDLAQFGDQPRAFLNRAKQHQLLHLALCDVVNLPGIGLFIFAGDTVALLLFALASLLLFLLALPSGKNLGVAMFRQGRPI